MNRTRPLLAGEYVEGARVVETTVRPVRPMCLIPEDDPRMAARFAESRSLAWGGQASYALPYSRSEGLREPWRQLFDLLDPDVVLALGTFPRANPYLVTNDGTREPARSLEERLWGNLDRMVYAAEEPERLFVIASTLMHTVLQAVGEHLKPPDGSQFVAVPKLPARSTYYLPMIARYGLVNDTELNRVLGSAYTYRYRVDLDIGRSVRVKELNAAGDLLGTLSGDLGGLLDSDVRQRALTLPELTLRGLEIRGRVVPRGVGRWEGEDRHEMGFYAPVVVTGDKESVEDFVLYWNLRSEHYFAEPFPLWMPIELLDSADAFAAVERALERVHPGMGQTAPQMADVLITSASMEETELRERLGGRYSEASISTNDPIGLFTEACEYRYAVEKLPAQFARGRASIQPPRPEELKKSLIPGVDRVAYEVGVDGVRLPQAEAVAWHLGWLHSRDEISKWGNLRFVKPFNKDFSERDLLDLGTPDGWTLLRSIFEERGYDVAPTDKSRAALGQLALVGGVENLKVLASSKIRELLKRLV